MQTTNTINITRAGGEEHWLIGADVTTVKASGRSTGGELLVLENAVPRGAVPRSCTGTRIRRSSSSSTESSKSARWTRTAP